MSRLAVVLLSSSVMLVPACDAAQDVDPAALAKALSHVRTVVQTGDVQVSADTVPPGAEDLLMQAARMAGFSYGPEADVATGGTMGRCFPVGEFRGVAGVWEISPEGPDRIVVTLQILQLHSDRCLVHEQVDLVTVERPGSSAEWRITEVVRILES